MEGEDPDSSDEEGRATDETRTRRVGTDLVRTLLRELESRRGETVIEVVRDDEEVVVEERPRSERLRRGEVERKRQLVSAEKVILT